MPVIKSTDQETSRHGAAFNFDDIASQANEYLAKVKIEAGKIIKDAREQAEQAKREADQYQEQQKQQVLDAAYKEGYENGRQCGAAELQQAIQEEASRQIGERIHTLLPALQETIGQVEQTKHLLIKHWERSALGVARAIAERIIRRELASDPTIPQTLVAEALELASGSSRIRIYLSPDDYDAILPQVETLAQELARMAETEIIPDPEVGPGGCRVETPLGVIDQRIESQLERMEEELR